ncbi:MAG: prephenate dehydrogenase/arogenate dehydrogenase family protein [Lentisphaerae bacterium]|nr:prephenate dehydrogenase/arogenate dehydrogenase family protein [Lentisphaerota bacterium]
MKKISIVGLGLMGGSLGLALRKARGADEICAYARREETRKLALERGVADVVEASVARAVAGADLVVFCVPVLAVPALSRECLAEFSEGCVVTDVGSTKLQLIEEMDSVLSGTGATFVGSHPIAGSERAGLEAAREDLYAGALVAVTPRTGSDEPDPSVDCVKELWCGLGCQVKIMSPDDHDRVIAATSHLPHVVASLLVETAVREDTAGPEGLWGGGLRDTTRIAAGSEDIWHDIVKTNRTFVSAELERFSKLLDRVRAMIERGDFDDVKAFLAESRRKRQALDSSDGE